MNNAFEPENTARWTPLRCPVSLAIFLSLFFLASRPAAAEAQTPFLIRGVEVNDKAIRFEPGKEVNLGASPQHILFYFGANTNVSPAPLRVRCKLDGLDADWRVGGGEMYLIARFYNQAGDRVGEKKFMVHGDSPGWNGTLSGSTLTHRRETLTVPPDASRLWIVISSAGPPSTIGVYVVDNLVVSGPRTNSATAEILLRSPPAQSAAEDSDTVEPSFWHRDGTHPSMAKVVEIGEEPKSRALAIVDDDRLGHAEWHNSPENAAKVFPNESVVVEWNEMYSIGESDLKSTGYTSLAPGVYHFRVGEATVFGIPAGLEDVLTVRVPVSVWERPWFWTLIVFFIVGSSAMSVRYVAHRKTQQAMLELRQQRALEQERLRIARDIHDDLGARVTQISLLSAMAQNDATYSKKAREQFDKISTMSRDLVSALYETVWAVNPENDNLDAMANYLCEKITEFCDPARIRCRLHVPELPKNVEISSRVRHNLSMAVNEAMNNITKHAGASQVTAHFEFAGSCLTISIQDDGHGFQPDGSSLGNGLVNMNRRMEEIGGSCQVESAPGKGTSIILRLVIDPDREAHPPMGAPAAEALLTAPIASD